MRMHCLLFIATPVLLSVGCAKPVPGGRASVLSPGRDMRLVYRFEMHQAGADVTVAHILTSEVVDGVEVQSTVTKQEEMPFTSVEWGEVELALRVAAVPVSDSLRVTMVFQGYRSGNISCEEGQEKHEESYGSEAGPEADAKAEAENLLRDAEFIAVIGPQGRLTSSDITGKHWARRKKELADAVKQGASQAQADVSLRWGTPGIFAALEDAMAYLPPEGTRAGQSWTVRREHVLPYHTYGFYMLTSGCSTSEEDATCTLKSMRPRGPHSIATITIRGKRIPHDPERGMPQRVKHFELEGELEVNITTGAVEKLRIESTPTWVRPTDESSKASFVEVVTLKPK